MIESTARRAQGGAASRSARARVLMLLVAAVVCGLGVSDLEPAAAHGHTGWAAVSTGDAQTGDAQTGDAQTGDAQTDEHGPTCHEPGPGHDKNVTQRAERLPPPQPDDLLVEDSTAPRAADVLAPAHTGSTSPVRPIFGRRHLIEAQISRT